MEKIREWKWKGVWSAHSVDYNQIIFSLDNELDLKIDRLRREWEDRQEEFHDEDWYYDDGIHCEKLILNLYNITTGEFNYDLFQHQDEFISEKLGTEYPQILMGGILNKDISEYLNNDPKGIEALVDITKTILDMNFLSLIREDMTLEDFSSFNEIMDLVEVVFANIKNVNIFNKILMNTAIDPKVKEHAKYYRDRL